MMGSIDLSIEGIVGLSGVVASYLVKNLSNSHDFGFLAVLICVVVGAIFGLLNGYIFSSFKIPSFMTTLGIGFITIGIGILVTKGNPIVITDWGFRQLGVGKIGIIPVVFIVAAVLIAMMWFINEKTIFGRHILAVGGDEAIAQDLGIRVKRIKIGVLGIAGAQYGLVGALLTAKLGSGDIAAPLGFTFDSIGACVLGGIAITGGVGSIPKAITGAFILTVLRNGMILMGVNPYVQQGIIGILLITTVALTIDRKKIKIMK
jgi:ribose transport system permease protein